MPVIPTHEVVELKASRGRDVCGIGLAPLRQHSRLDISARELFNFTGYRQDIDFHQLHLFPNRFGVFRRCIFDFSHHRTRHDTNTTNAV